MVFVRKVVQQDHLSSMDNALAILDSYFKGPAYPNALKASTCSIEFVNPALILVPTASQPQPTAYLVLKGSSTMRQQDLVFRYPAAPMASTKMIMAVASSTANQVSTINTFVSHHVPATTSAMVLVGAYRVV